MDTIWGNAVAGLIGALAATAILGVGQWVRLAFLRHLDLKYIREVITDGRTRVIEAEDTYNSGLDTTLPANELRCAKYNLMMKQLTVALDHRTSKLSHDHRKALFDVLDWYHTESLLVTKDGLGNPVFVDLPDGKWPMRKMQKSHAVDIFKRLESIKWLKLKPYGYGHSENS